MEDTSLLENPEDDVITSSAYLNEEEERYYPDYYERIELLLLERTRKKSPRNLIPLILFGPVSPEQFYTKEDLEKLLE